MMTLEQITNLPAGKTVYFRYDTGRTGKGVIDKITNTEILGTTVVEINTGSNCYPMFLRNLFEDQDAMDRYEEELEEQRFRERLATVRTVEDLVRFMYDNTVSEADEYTDEIARKVAAAKAKELLGIDLDARQDS